MPAGISVAEHGPVLTAREPREVVLDLAGLKCPLPVLHARRALRRLSPGDSLVVVCTDPMSVIDLPNLAREEGDAVTMLERGGSATRIGIRRGAASAKPPQS